MTTRAPVRRQRWPPRFTGRMLPRVPFLLLLATLARPLAAQAPCRSCAEWNAPQVPFRVYGNTWYVGTHGLSALLITSNEGHVLLDGGLPESAPRILASIRALGFRVEDVKLILNSHDHYDHAGGIARLRKQSGAAVAASASSARVLETGAPGPDDPQYGILPPIEPVGAVRVIGHGDTLRVGPITVVAHITAGHTPGGTTWTWESCVAGRCLDLVYADSQTPVSADDFFFTRSGRYPTALADFANGFAVLDRLSCDILVTPHPDATSLWQRLERREGGAADALIDSTACRRYAADARARLAQRVATERAKT